MEFIINRQLSLKDLVKHYFRQLFSRPWYLKFAILFLVTVFLILARFKNFTTEHFAAENELKNKWRLKADKFVVRMMADDQVRLPKVSNFIHGYGSFYHFYRIPRRFKKAFYSEMTSANPDTAHPLAPDFSFHLTYDKNKVKIFHDTNCGCIYRIYMLPPFSSYLNKVDLLKPQDLKNLFLEITLDDVTTIYSLTEILEGEKGPFLSPVSSKNSKPLSGIGSYTPFCYAKSASIHYVDDNEYPTNLLNLTVSCVANELKCPIKQYTAVSYMKSSCLPDEQSTFSQLNKENFANLDYLVEYFKYPENYGPHDDDGCNLVCEDFSRKNKIIKLIERWNRSAVVVSIVLTELLMNDDDEINERYFEDWNDIFLSVTVDGSSEPQIYISLGVVFVTKGFKTEFISAPYGRSYRGCNYLINLNSTLTWDVLQVGYFFLPIPYWHDIKINLEYRNEDIRKKKKICYQVLENENFYDEKQTGHLYGHNVFHSGETERWREVLSVAGGWGHLVSLAVEINNLKPILDAPLIERWAALQADPVIYIDGFKSPRVRGTGLEDYFSFSHGFAGAENTSFAFVGVPYGFENKETTGKSWSCYRHHIFDPVLFDDSIEFIMEGTHEDEYYKEARKLTFTEYKSLEASLQTSFVYTPFYYFKKHSKNVQYKYCDDVIFCEDESLASHSFKSSTTPILFRFDSLKYLGDSKHNFEEKNVCGFSFKNLTNIKFQLIVPSTTDSKLVFTRKYYSKLYQWNDKCLVNYNGYTFEWLFSIGPTNSDYSLREDSIILPILDSGKTTNEFNFQLTVLSDWNDISYTLCSITE
ncbi:hypothetical protein HELRODRAFT_193453 [Helobdella robusta]|uniref:Uncharacterized protein n=1 Tax=Helobdella robusta TaxID=6412 RepID=T1FV02_HELRO|nr:hypothetical protein HELRODRAFT_193453 [Helobdella robusta]ESN95955.1 hypothetical protein HELRODRAFT_193453 [Helobdella robusta]